MFFYPIYNGLYSTEMSTIQRILVRSTLVDVSDKDILLLSEVMGVLGNVFRSTIWDSITAKHAGAKGRKSGCWAAGI